MTPESPTISLPEITVATFYKFVPLPDFAEMRKPFRDLCNSEEVYGTILLSPEGVNATIAGPRSGVANVLARLRSDPRLNDLEHKESVTHEMPFRRMKVRLKKEIMGLGQPLTNPLNTVGHYVKPEDWNSLIQDPDVLLIDTRNDYEVAVGTFPGAIDPHLKTFREFAEFVAENLDRTKHTKVAMFCTGGIRCEKASSFMLDHGFPEVFHLQGGILKYLETVPSEQSLWAGECFVFDERVAVDHGLKATGLQRCFGCGSPTTEDDRLSEKFEAGISCPACHDVMTPKARARREMRQAQHQMKHKKQDAAEKCGASAKRTSHDQ